MFLLAMSLFHPGHGFARGFMQLPARFFMCGVGRVHDLHLFAGSTCIHSCTAIDLFNKG